MLICDRCGKKLKRQREETKKIMTMYHAEGAYVKRDVDLCDDCLHKLEVYIGKAQSYFMAETENEPIDIINKVKYWNRGWQ